MGALEDGIRAEVRAGVTEALAPVLRRLVEPECLTYTIPQAAIVIGVKDPTVRRLVDEGVLPLVPHMPGRRLIPRAAVEAFILQAVDSIPTRSVREVA